MSDQQDSPAVLGASGHAGSGLLPPDLDVSPKLGGAGKPAPLFLEVDAETLRLQLFNAVARYPSQRKFAAANGISPAIVSLTLAGKREPDRSVAAALGYVPVVTFRRVREMRDV